MTLSNYGQVERAEAAGLSLPTIDSVRAGCYSDAQLEALIHDMQHRAGEIDETTSVEEANATLAGQDGRETPRRLPHFVVDAHIWPDGWKEARSYLPLNCPCCERSRLLYAVCPEKPSEGILVHCEKCRSASYDEVDLGVSADER